MKFFTHGTRIVSESAFVSGDKNLNMTKRPGYDAFWMRGNSLIWCAALELVEVYCKNHFFLFADIARLRGRVVSRKGWLRQSIESAGVYVL